MSKKTVTLNSQQLHELKWFCRNVVGTRREFYKVLDEVLSFKEKIDRLQRTSDSIEKHLKELGEKDFEIKPFESWLGNSTGQ